MRRAQACVKVPFIKRPIETMLEYQSPTLDRAFHIQFDITNSCNLHCSHCYHSDHKNTGALSLSEWISALDQYAELLKHQQALPNIMICGGEPLLSPDFFKFLDAIISRWDDTMVTVLTNGNLIYKHIERLKNYPLQFQISLEGPNAEAHDSIRGPGTFEKSISGVRLLKAEHFWVHIATVLSRHTVHLIDQMFALAKQLEVDSLNFNRLVPIGHSIQKRKPENETLLGIELKIALEKIVEASRMSGIRTNTNKPLYALLNPSFVSPKGLNPAGVVIGYRGDVKVTSRSPIIIGNIKNETLTKIYESSDLVKKLSRTEIETCGNCHLAKVCSGDRNISYAMNGDILSVDPGCWLTKEG